MPKISEFFGILIYMYFEDHNPPHFHAIYGEHEALISIEELQVIKGYLPPRAFGLAVEWAMIHKQELKENWKNASNLIPLEKIEPLK